MSRSLQQVFILTGLSALFVSVAPNFASAQAPTTVQLPTYSFFTVNTTVSVPDSGGSYLGGILRGRDSSSMRGLAPFPGLANRGISSDRMAGGMSIRAVIHDFHKLDEALLAEAATKRRETDPAALKGAALADSIEKPSGNPAADAPLASVAEIRRQNEEQDASKREEAMAYFTKAEEYRTAGKLGLAKLNYQRAASRDVGKVKEAALKRIQQLEQKPAEK